MRTNIGSVFIGFIGYPEYSTFANADSLPTLVLPLMCCCYWSLAAFWPTYG